MQIEFNAQSKDEVLAVHAMTSALLRIEPLQVVDAAPAAPAAPTTAPIVPQGAAPASTPAAPATPPAAPATPPAAPAGELDAAGIPWDARIHSSGKTKKNDGTWVARRGVQKGTFEQVMAELTANAGQATETPPATTPAAAGSNVTQMPGTEAGAAPGSAEDAQAAAVFGNLNAPPAGDEALPQTWPEVLNEMTKMQVAGTYDVNKVTAFMAQHQMGTDVALMAARPDLYGPFIQALRA